MPTLYAHIVLGRRRSELEVLKGIDFDKYAFGRIDVEHNYVEPSRTEMKARSKGYMWFYGLQWDECLRSCVINAMTTYNR